MQTVMDYVKESIDKRYVKYTKDMYAVARSLAASFNEKGNKSSSEGRVFSIINDNPIYLIEDQDYINFLERIGTRTYNQSYISAGREGSLRFLDLCEILDIDTEKVTEGLVNAIHHREDMTIIGFGGMVGNMDQFLTKFNGLSDMTLDKYGRRYLRIENVFENDHISFHNLPRIYDLQNYYLDFIASDSYNYVNYQKPSNKLGYFKEKHIEDVINDFIFGAMDVETRALLSKHKIPYLATLHSGEDCFIVENQTMNGLESETYGKINISIFLLNVLKLTEYFATHCINKPLSEYSEDKTVFTFNARKYLKEKYKKDTDATIKTIQNNFEYKKLFLTSTINPKAEIEKICDRLVAFELRGITHVLF